ncbi:hypothetical protein C1637_19850 [Chryseobacterium lactis]|uniref:Uncharacterized protein n=1 Tax=Chryseobacterium lactis TaxID=1241981 RepID=A0A3G6RKI2_CHRLC|nr:hypothetical protein [Chryseobacterium lactis]AZA83104.1 hypothetical protein EG342_14965 [Chryseobacterium lactis]AZB03487.1 hypothetical protein EG341_05835 [Chryseobacterium lactis]PNW12009.1 hypothetical protein C1637_19850 [Chryseobacterium lactis]
MDKKAIQILLETIKKAQTESLSDWFYWDTYIQYISKEDFEYAKKHSVMYDQENVSHDEICRRIKIAVARIDKQDVVNAFLYSLTKRQLEYRSFLSSYCIGKSLPEHSFAASPKPNEGICAVCGLHTYEFEQPVEFNTINYFKYKDGACFDNLIQVLFDLEQFPELSAVKPNENDREILDELKKIIETAESDDRISKLKKKISKTFKSNDEERQGVLEILGVIGILHDDQHFGYADQYATYPDREQRPIRNDDVGYPARWWQGKFGIDQEKWEYWFGNK